MTTWTQEKIDDCISQCTTKAVVDADFRAELITNPIAAAKQETGLEIPAGVRIKVLENDPAYDFTFLLPDPVTGAVDENSLDEVVGGGSCGSFSSGRECYNFNVCSNDNAGGSQGKGK